MRRITVLLAMLAVTLAGAIVAFGGSTVSAQESDPVAVVQALIEEFNQSGPTGDGAAIAAHFTEDGAVTFLEVDGSFGVFGRAAMEIAFSEEPDGQFRVTVVEISATGGTVTGAGEFRDSGTVEAGIERGLFDFTAVVVDGKVASLDVVDDLSDPQTAQLAAFLASQPDEGGEDEAPPSEDFVELNMGGNQPGHAGAGSFEGVVFAFVEVDPGPEGLRQPSGIYEGTCDELGELAQRLAPVWNGTAGSIISADFDHLLDEPHAITVGDSPDNASVIVSCANLTRSAPGVGLPSTGTGGSSSNDLSWLIAALALVGVAFAGAGTLVARRRS